MSNTTYVMTAFKRYGSLIQVNPLTADEQKYDDTCREIDALETELGAKSIALFTASEFIRFSRFVTKMHVCPDQKQLDDQLSYLLALRATLNERNRAHQ